MEVRELLTEKSRICECILRALPDWFGLEDAIRSYVKEVELLDVLVAELDRPVGFLALKLHNEYVAEIYVMGVLPQLHRKGIGRSLVAAAEQRLRSRRFEFLQVKTLSPSHPDANYASTRAFYMAMGFRPVEEFKNLWGAANPCLLLIKSLQAA